MSNPSSHPSRSLDLLHIIVNHANEAAAVVRYIMTKFGFQKQALGGNAHDGGLAVAKESLT